MLENLNLSVGNKEMNVNFKIFLKTVMVLLNR